MKSRMECMKNYTEAKKVFFDLERCDKAHVPFNFIIGGRGTGKTYATLSRCKDLYEKGIPEWGIEPGTRFMYLRRGEVEVQSIADQYYNPFKAINNDFHTHITSSYMKKNNMGLFHDDIPEVEDRNHIGYASALSVFANLRGADLSDVSVLVFDEFIKEGVKKTMKGEADAFFNAYETISRNRELRGLPPLVTYLLSNATDIESPLLAELGLIEVIESMLVKKQSYYTDRNRGIHMEILSSKDIQIINMRKEHNAIAKLTKGTKYYRHAQDNEFSYNSFQNIGKENIRHYYPYIQVNGVYIYRSKSDMVYYACHSKGKCQYVYEQDSIPMFRRQFGIEMFNAIHSNRMIFENYKTKMEVLSNFPESK